MNPFHILVVFLSYSYLPQLRALIRDFFIRYAMPILAAAGKHTVDFIVAFCGFLVNACVKLMPLARQLANGLLDVPHPPPPRSSNGTTTREQQSGTRANGSAFALLVRTIFIVFLGTIAFLLAEALKRQHPAPGYTRRRTLKLETCPASATASQLRCPRRRAIMDAFRCLPFRHSEDVSAPDHELYGLRILFGSDATDKHPDSGRHHQLSTSNVDSSATRRRQPSTDVYRSTMDNATDSDVIRKVPSNLARSPAAVHPGQIQPIKPPKEDLGNCTVEMGEEMVDPRLVPLPQESETSLLSSASSIHNEMSGGSPSEAGAFHGVVVENKGRELAMTGVDDSSSINSAVAEDSDFTFCGDDWYFILDDDVASFDEDEDEVEAPEKTYLTYDDYGPHRLIRKLIKLVPFIPQTIREEEETEEESFVVVASSSSIYSEHSLMSLQQGHDDPPYPPEYSALPVDVSACSLTCDNVPPHDASSSLEESQVVVSIDATSRPQGSQVKLSETTSGLGLRANRSLSARSISARSLAKVKRALSKASLLKRKPTELSGLTTVNPESVAEGRTPRRTTGKLFSRSSPDSRPVADRYVPSQSTWTRQFYVGICSLP